VPKNLPAQRARHVDRVDQGTGEALPGPATIEPHRKWSPYKPDAKSVLRPKGVRGVIVPRMAVQENAAGGKDPCFVYASHAGKRG